MNFLKYLCLISLIGLISYAQAQADANCAIYNTGESKCLVCKQGYGFKGEHGTCISNTDAVANVGVIANCRMYQVNTDNSVQCIYCDCKYALRTVDNKLACYATEFETQFCRSIVSGDSYYCDECKHTQGEYDKNTNKDSEFLKINKGIYGNQCLIDNDSTTSLTYQTIPYTVTKTLNCQYYSDYKIKEQDKNNRLVCDMCFPQDYPQAVSEKDLKYVTRRALLPSMTGDSSPYTNEYNKDRYQSIYSKVQIDRTTAYTPTTDCLKLPKTYQSYSILPKRDASFTITNFNDNRKQYAQENPLLNYRLASEITDNNVNCINNNNIYKYFKGQFNKLGYEIVGKSSSALDHESLRTEAFSGCYRVYVAENDVDSSKDKDSYDSVFNYLQTAAPQYTMNCKTFENYLTTDITAAQQTQHKLYQSLYYRRNRIKINPPLKPKADDLATSIKNQQLGDKVQCNYCDSNSIPAKGYISKDSTTTLIESCFRYIKNCLFYVFVDQTKGQSKCYQCEAGYTVQEDENIKTDNTFDPLKVCIKNKFLDKSSKVGAGCRIVNSANTANDTNECNIDTDAPPSCKPGWSYQSTNQKCTCDQPNTKSKYAYEYMEICQSKDYTTPIANCQNQIQNEFGENICILCKSDTDVAGKTTYFLSYDSKKCLPILGAGATVADKDKCRVTDTNGNCIMCNKVTQWINIDKADECVTKDQVIGCLFFRLSSDGTYTCLKCHPLFYMKSDGKCYQTDPFCNVQLLIEGPTEYTTAYLNNPSQCMDTYCYAKFFQVKDVSANNAVFNRQAIIDLKAKMLAADTADTADAVLLSKYVSGMCVPNVVKNTEVVIKNGEVASPTAIGDCVCKDLTQSSTADLKCNTITDFANYFKFNTDTCYTVGYATLLTTDFMKDTGQVMKLISLQDGGIEVKIQKDNTKSDFNKNCQDDSNAAKDQCRICKLGLISFHSPDETLYALNDATSANAHTKVECFTPRPGCLKYETVTEALKNSVAPFISIRDTAKTQIKLSKHMYQVCVECMPGYIFNTNNECIDMSLFTTSADASTLAKHYVGCKVVHQKSWTNAVNSIDGTDDSSEWPSCLVCKDANYELLWDELLQRYICVGPKGCSKFQRNATSKLLECIECKSGQYLTKINAGSAYSCEKSIDNCSGYVKPTDPAILGFDYNKCNACASGWVLQNLKDNDWCFEQNTILNCKTYKDKSAADKTFDKTQCALWNYNVCEDSVTATTCNTCKNGFYSNGTPKGCQKLADAAYNICQNNNNSSSCKTDFDGCSNQVSPADPLTLNGDLRKCTLCSAPNYGLLTATFNGFAPGHCMKYDKTNGVKNCKQYDSNNKCSACHDQYFLAQNQKGDALYCLYKKGCRTLDKSTYGSTLTDDTTKTPSITIQKDITVTQTSDFDLDNSSNFVACQECIPSDWITGEHKDLKGKCTQVTKGKHYYGCKLVPDTITSTTPFGYDPADYTVAAKKPDMRKCKQCWNIETNVVDKFNLVNNNEDSSTVDNAKNILVGTESNSSGNIVNVVLGTCVKIQITGCLIGNCKIFLAKEGVTLYENLQCHACNETFDLNSQTRVCDTFNTKNDDSSIATVSPIDTSKRGTKDDNIFGTPTPGDGGVVPAACTSCPTNCCTDKCCPTKIDGKFIEIGIEHIILIICAVLAFVF